MNHTNSLAINLPQTKRCKKNFQFRILELSLKLERHFASEHQQSTLWYWQQAIWLSHQKTMSHRLVVLMTPTSSLSQIFTFKRCTRDFVKENDFHSVTVMFCYYSKLFSIIYIYTIFFCVLRRVTQTYGYICVKIHLLSTPPPFMLQIHGFPAVCCATIRLGE